MPNPRIYRADAIVLRQRNLGEADRIVTLFTADHGKIDAVAKGVRRPGSRKAGHLEVLEHVSLLLARGRSLDIITQAEALETFLPLRDDMRLLAPALYIAELTDRFTAEESDNPPLFDLVLTTLRRLTMAPDRRLVLRAFEMGLLAFAGYQPELLQCVQCTLPLRPVVNAFSPAAGGAVCPACTPVHSGLRALSVNALKVLRLLAQGAYAQAARLRLSDELAVELEQHLRASVRVHLDRDLQSLDFLHAAGRTPPPVHSAGVLS